MMNYRYDLIGASLLGVEEHPQTQMRKLGYKIIKSEPFTISDCWVFRVSNEIKDIPTYLTLVRSDFKFTDEE